MVSLLVIVLLLYVNDGGAMNPPSPSLLGPPDSGRAEAMTRALFLEAPVNVVLMDPSTGLVLDLNEQAAVSFGGTVDELRGGPVLDLFPPDEHANVANQLQQTLRHGTSTSEHRIVTPAGIDRWVQVRRRLVGEGPDAVIVAFGFDVTWQRQAQLEVMEIKAFQDAVLRVQPDSVSIIDLASGAVRWQCGQDVPVGGASSRQVAAEDWLATQLDPRARPGYELFEELIRRTADGEVIREDFQGASMDAEPHWLSFSATPFRRDDAGQLVEYCVAVRDVTADFKHLAAVEETLALREALLRASPDIVGVHSRGQLEDEWWSRSPAIALGYPSGDHAEPSLRSLLHLADLRAWEQRRKDGAVDALRLRLRTAQGSYRWYEEILTPVSSSQSGERSRVVCTLRDVQHVVAQEAYLIDVASRDQLTGLLNRRAILTQLEGPLTRDLAVAVLYADLDHFKPINDTFGHAEGDAVLRVVAERIRSVTRLNQPVGRIGGDEFVVVLIADGEPAQEAADHLAERIRQVVGAPIRIGPNTHQVTISVGVAVASGRSGGELLAEADRAMYQAKARR